MIIEFVPSALILISILRTASSIEFDKNASDPLHSDFTGDSNKECLGNRAEASEIGRQCSRKCRKDMPCENTRKQCLCDGLCGLSCLKPDLSCPELPKLENGIFSPKTILFQSRVVYQCDPGYYLFGSRERLCQGDEEWSGTPADCMIEPLCRTPIKVNHARNPNDGVYRLNDKVNYSCYPGYQSRGIPEAVCKLIEKNHTAWRWTGSPFRCIPKSCGDPGQIENGKRQGETFIIASSVLYSCLDGFDLIGQARRHCQSDNQWSGQAPHCEPVTCNPTDHLDNGKINYVYPLVFNTTVEYTCDYGFKLIGPQRRTCGHEKKLLGPMPKCEEIDCGELGPLPNGRIIGFSNRMADRKEFICNDGMKFVGESRESVCQESGSWSNPLPQCLAPCPIPLIERAQSMFIIPIITSMVASARSNVTLNVLFPGTLVSHGSSIEVSCQEGYELDEQMNDDGVIRSPVCKNQTWSYMPRCKIVNCRPLPRTPKNARLRVASIEHGAIGYIHCLDGYRLIGNNVTHCNKGEWSPIESNCSEIYCSHPGHLDNGRILLVGQTGMYDYKPYIKKVTNNRQIAYECESGYRLADGAPSGATCIDGRWKPDGLSVCMKE